MIKKIIKLSGGLLLLFILFLAGFLAYMTITDFKPQKVVLLDVQNNRQNARKLSANIPFSILTFNIGYCGLDKNEDFFMDGGTMSRSSSRAQTQANLEKITSFIGSKNADVILLQEIDLDSSRSFHIDELDYIKTRLKDYAVTFGVNYKVPWVPVPMTNPMGSVYSGIVSFANFSISSGARYQYPGNESWPVQLFELDRCFVENRIPVAGGRELVLINSHLSAFDKGGEIRKKQLAFLKSYITGEFKKGNYVIVGGDWNHALPGTDPKIFKTTEQWPFWLQTLPGDFTPDGFKWAVDKNIPSVRTNAKSYKKGENFTVVIDGFLVSPNVTIMKVTGYDLDFENSDHNPVIGMFVLNP